MNQTIDRIVLTRVYWIHIQEIERKKIQLRCYLGTNVAEELIHHKIKIRNQWLGTTALISAPGKRCTVLPCKLDGRNNLINRSAYIL